MEPNAKAGAYTPTFVISTSAEAADEQARAARQQVLRLHLVVAAALGIVLAALGWLVLGAVGAVIGLLLGVGLVAAVVFTGESRLRNGLDARALSATDAPRLHNLVDGLVVTVGVTPPEVVVVDDDGVNLGLLRGRSSSALIVTTGAIEHLDRLALEGVLARELHRLRADAHLVEGAAAGLVGWLSHGLAARLAGERHGLERELLLDAEAMRHTRYPPGLAAGLVGADARPGPGRATLGVSWMIDPTERARAEVQVRIAALDER